MNPPSDPTGRKAPTEAACRRLAAFLKEELARTSAEALANGTSPDALTRQIEDRIAELQRQLAAPTRNARP